MLKLFVILLIINKSDLIDNYLLVLLWSICSQILKSNQGFDLDSIQYIFDALQIHLTCNYSKFRHQHFLQTDGMAQERRMSCFCANIFRTKYDFLTNKFQLRLTQEKIYRRCLRIRGTWCCFSPLIFRVS